MERCFFCRKKMDTKTGLCTNPACPRSKPLTPPHEEVSEEPEQTVAEEEVTKDDDVEQVTDESHVETVTETTEDIDNNEIGNDSVKNINDIANNLAKMADALSD